MRFLLLVLVGACCSCSTPKQNPKVTAHLCKVEYRAATEVAERLNEELSGEYLNLLILPEWRMQWVMLMSIDDSELPLEVIKRLESRVRELDRPAEPSAK